MTFIIRRNVLILSFALSGPVCGQVDAATPAGTSTQLASAPAAGLVHPLDPGALAERFNSLPGRQHERVRLYFDAARRSVLDVTDGCYPDPDYRTHYRNLAERAKGAAVLSSFPGIWPDELRRRCRRETAGYLREIADAWQREPNFRYPWQAAFWAAEAGIAAWFLWDELDAGLRETMAAMIVYQADRFIGKKPATRFQENTEAETVSWDSSILTLAVNMMPEHPNVSAWDRAARTWLYNTFSVPADGRDDTPGDDGRAIREWFVGPNLYPDFGLENHRMFHIDYVLACYRFHVQGAALYALTGRPLPQAFRHHARDVYERILLPCMDAEGFFVYVSDNDWKRYHSWTESCSIHAYLAFLEDIPLAAALEDRALRNATERWQAMPAGFSYDNPYVCGKPWTSRIADAVLLHLAWPRPRPSPLAPAQVDQRLLGTVEVPSAHLLTHHAADGSLRSFCKGKQLRPEDAPQWIRFFSPTGQRALVLPLAGNYRGEIDETPILPDGHVYTAHGQDWFWVLRQADNGNADAFISLPGEAALHIEYAPAGSLPAGQRVLNTVAIEKPHAERVVQYQGGRAICSPASQKWSHTDDVDGPAIDGTWVHLDSVLGVRFAVPEGSGPPTLHLPDPAHRSALRARTAIQAGRPHLLALSLYPTREVTTPTPLPLAIEASSDARTDELRYLRCRVGHTEVIVNLSPAPLPFSTLNLPRQRSNEAVAPHAVVAWSAEGRREF